jgi:hypothetical protein
VCKSKLIFLRLLLDRAALPYCNVHLQNLTTMTSMVGELQELSPPAPWLNAIVLGRVLHRVLTGLLTWHGASHIVWSKSKHDPIVFETTCYRFSEVGRARKAFKSFLGDQMDWSNDFDRWQNECDRKYLLIHRKV